MRPRMTPDDPIAETRGGALDVALRPVRAGRSRLRGVARRRVGRVGAPWSGRRGPVRDGNWARLVRRACRRRCVALRRHRRPVSRLFLGITIRRWRPRFGFALRGRVVGGTRLLRGVALRLPGLPGRGSSRSPVVQWRPGRDVFVRRRERRPVGGFARRSGVRRGAGNHCRRDRHTGRRRAGLRRLAVHPGAGHDPRRSRRKLPGRGSRAHPIGRLDPDQRGRRPPAGGRRVPVADALGRAGGERRPVVRHHGLGLPHDRFGVELRGDPRGPAHLPGPLPVPWSAAVLQSNP